MCPTGVAGMLMSSVCKKMSFWQEAGMGGGVREERGAQRQLSSSRNLRGWEFNTMNKGPPFQLRVFLSFLSLFLKVNMHPPVICLRVQNKKELSVQVKNKPCVGIQIVHLFLVPGPHVSER